MQDIAAALSDRPLLLLLEALDAAAELTWTPKARMESRWTGHLPVLAWLVRTHQPQVLVDISGDAAGFAAACEMIADHRLPTRAYAVGATVPAGADFATAVEADAEAAPTRFAPGSVDLLRLAAPLTAAAARRRLAAWRPALSPRAVVLCHGTNLRDGESWLWQAWQEQAAVSPAFEFLHHGGIGILCVGPQLSPTLRALFELDETPEDAALIRRLFAMRGEALCWPEQQHALQAELAAARATLAEAAAVREDNIRKDLALLQAGETLRERDAAIARLEAEAQRRDKVLREREAGLALQQLASRQRLEEAQTEIRRLQNSVRLYRESSSWRITAPLRGATELIQRLRRSQRPLRLPALRRPRLRPAAPALPPAAPAGDVKAALRAGLLARMRLFLASGERLKLPGSLRPDVSIILVLYNQAELTFGCLSSIADCLAASELRIEVVVLDNGSTDATAELLARLDGATIIHSADNLHFLRGANRAAREARGRHLLLLNNDAQLLPGAVEAALDAFEASENVGAVGARIVLPDGTLQEAGSIIWQDGSCLGYARGRDPTDAEVLFRRDVDYCSGAFLLTPRDVFERLGGLDERYAPAYYEETDYCVRLWQAGYRVVYEPGAVVLHFEFGSASDSAEAVARQQRNLATFRARHRDWLAAQLPPAPENVLAARQVRSDAPRVLMIEDRVPHPQLGAGYPRANDLLRTLAAHARVTLFPMMQFSETAAGVRASVPPEVEVLTDRHLPDLAEFLRQRRGSFDAVLICRPHNMKLFVDSGGADPALLGEAKLIFDAEAIFATREILRQATAGTPLAPEEAQRLLESEMALARRADVVLAVSAAEQRVFAEHGAQSTQVLGHALAATPTAAPFATRTDILFVGASHEQSSPNADSLLWFATEILPPLRRELGVPIRLKVVGENRVPAISQLDGTDFELVGAVDDLRPHYEAARLVVAPTRSASGIPHKIAQAAAHGVPVVATELLARQLGWEPERDLLAVSDPAAFAAACARLYRDEALWHRLRSAALERVREECDPRRFEEAVVQLLDGVPRGSPSARAAMPVPHAYGDWVRRYDTLTRADRAAIRSRIAAMPSRPLLSVLLPAYGTPEPWLRRCLASVLDQLYPEWELCVVDDASPQPHVASVLREFAARDRRIRVSRHAANGGISAATQSALDMARGDFVVLLDHDDELADHALYMIAEALRSSPDLDMIFSDEDKIDTRGTRFDPWFKSDWNPDLMLSQNVVVHLAAYRRSMLIAAGGFRTGLEGSQDYDTTLRVAERIPPERIRHLPHILYHWRTIEGSVALATGEKEYPYETAARAIAEHLQRTGKDATVTREPHPGYYRVHWKLPADPPRVTVIMPTRDRDDLLRRAVDSVLSLTEYRNFELLVVDNGSAEPAAIAYLAEIANRPNVRVLRYDAPYSFAALNNWAVRQTDAPLLAFVNNDVEVISPGWLGEMASHALRPEVGAVGAKLYFPNGTVQHAGIVVGIGGLAGHPHLGLARGELGYFGRAAVAQQFSAVTAACMVVRRETFEAIGGFDEEKFAIAFNDVDLCLRLRQAGFAIVWTPYAELFHHESASLGAAQSAGRREQFERESHNLRTRWASAMLHDPFYNPNLTTVGGDFAPAFPPRAEKPWRS